MKQKDGFETTSFRNILSLCVNCRMCSLECPAGVDVSRLIVEARAKLAKHSGFSTTELALANNRLMSILASTFAPVSNWLMSLAATRLLLEKTMGFDRTRTLPAFQHGSLIQKARLYLRQTGPLAEPIDKAVYFADSYASYNDHQLALTTIQILRRFGVEVVLPDQRPAPLPAYVYGHLHRAKKDMTYNLQTLWPYVRQGYKIVCSEPSAAMFLKDELPLLDNSQPASDVSAATVELMEYLNALPTVSRELPDKKVRRRTDKISYHAPCHLKALNGAKNTMELFCRLGFPLEDLNSGCCGLAGTAGLQKKNHRLCDAIGQSLKDIIEQTNPDYILTECAACKMQIEHLTGRAVLHPVIMLNENLDRLDH